MTSLTGWKLAFAFVVFPGFAFTATMGLVLTWVDRFVSARVQWRKGPPLYQPFADMLKLMLKQTVVPAGASKVTFLFAPILGFAAMCVTAVLLFYVNFFPQDSFVGDLIVLVYLFALPPIAVIIGASASRNPLSAVGASREMTLYLGYELPFLLALAVPVIRTGGAIRLGDLVLAQQAGGPFLYSVSGAIAAVIVLICIQAKLGYPPFDIAEAEQEIMSGVLIEYSGVPFAMFRLTKAMMFFLMPCFLVTVFWGGLTSWWAILKFLAIAVLVILIKNTNPRFKIEHALRFFWFILGGLGIVAVILAFMKL
ncbi:MAG: NADH-quinone oxidoreductase subunit H [candidate division WOR-3 bacterium]|nr:NADH-quinone oxidoreductase subunit H [candidate division WOR-3 bacterium]